MRKPNKKTEIIITAFLAVIMIAGISGTVFFRKKAAEIEKVYNAASALNETMKSKYKTIETAQPAPPEIKTASEEKALPETDEIKPPSSEPVEFNIDFTGLNNECRFGSVAGWLYCEGTQIDYPIAQCEDNSYYLYRLLDGTENESGTLFTDCICTPDFRGTNTIVYGHNMLNGSMFGEISKYVTQEEFFEEHPTMTLFTPNGDYQIDIFSAFVTVTTNEFVWQPEFNTDVEYQEYLDYIKAENRIPTGPNIDVTVNDKIITLVTCSFDTDHSRTMVFGRLKELN